MIELSLQEYVPNSTIELFLQECLPSFTFAGVSYPSTVLTEVKRLTLRSHFVEVFIGANEVVFGLVIYDPILSQGLLIRHI